MVNCKSFEEHLANLADNFSVGPFMPVHENKPAPKVDSVAIATMLRDILTSDATYWTHISDKDPCTIFLRMKTYGVGVEISGLRIICRDNDLQIFLEAFNYMPAEVWQPETISYRDVWFNVESLTEPLISNLRETWMFSNKWLNEGSLPKKSSRESSLHVTQ